MSRVVTLERTQKPALEELFLNWLAIARLAVAQFPDDEIDNELVEVKSHMAEEAAKRVIELLNTNRLSLTPDSAYAQPKGNSLMDWRLGGSI